MFSCCERKLLTEVENRREKSELINKTVHICIKYSPCEICHRALTAYDKQGVKFEIISPAILKKWSNYLNIDNELKNYFKKI